MVRELGLIDTTPSMGLTAGLFCAIFVLWFLVDKLLMTSAMQAMMYPIYLLAQKGDEGDNQYGSPMSYEVVTAEEAACTGLKETPTDDMDRKFMYVCIAIIILELILMSAI